MATECATRTRPSCTDAACNYDDNPLAYDNTLCVYASDIYGVDNVDCDGECLNDADVANPADEIAGCTDEGTNNHDAAATDDDFLHGLHEPDRRQLLRQCRHRHGTCIISSCTEAEACSTSLRPTPRTAPACTRLTFTVWTTSIVTESVSDADSDGTCDEDEELDEVLDIISDNNDLDSTISILGDLVLNGGGSTTSQPPSTDSESDSFRIWVVSPRP